MMERVAQDLDKFGDRVVKEITAKGAQCEIDKPRLEQHDAWGKRVDSLWVCPEWRQLKGVCAEEGIIAIGYDDKTDPVARRMHQYRLHGYKWFSSAIDADVALTLARVVDDKGDAQAGSKGLSLFLLKIRKDDSQELNGIQMIKLKNKLGTRQLPTAELLLDGVVAYRLGDAGRGIPHISNMLNITRIHNAVASVAGMRRILSLARDYSTRRLVFGQPQEKWPLHLATLAKLEVEARGCFLMLMDAARLLGVQESGKATLNDLVMLRLITPVLKLYTAKQCVPLISEGIECFGGQGYIEDTGLPTLLRDAQVTPIWEGTTNVLSLDVLRVFSGKENVFQALNEYIKAILPKDGKPELKSSVDAVKKGMVQFGQILAKVNDSSLNSQMRVDVCARDIAFAIGKILSGSLLIRHASDADSTTADIEVAKRWCLEQELVRLDLEWFTKQRIANDRAIVFENYAGSARQSKL
ncbi:unnamed protein product, partial [Mesorhabditis spiculigera]